MIEVYFYFIDYHNGYGWSISKYYTDKHDAFVAREAQRAYGPSPIIMGYVNSEEVR